MVVSSIGNRIEATKLSRALQSIARCLRRRAEPLDGDARDLGELAMEIEIAAKTVGDWPHGILTRGRVLGWAHRMLATIHHLESVLGHEMEATCGYLRRTAHELQGHATGLRATGTWDAALEVPQPPQRQQPVAGEIDDDDEVDETADTRRMEVDELAETSRIKPILRKPKRR